MATQNELSLTPQKHKVVIEYCVPCDYSDHVLRVTEELVRNYQHVISELVLHMGSRGVFEILVNDEVLFSKKDLSRHPEPGEALALFREYVGSEVSTYPRR
ncbi:MAG: hypothetical protein CL608_06615 [Anaerolineaceae bacterium]|nr:hypothetical protein [Anaerolineaceae bacterium]